MGKRIYLIGSLRNELVPIAAEALRIADFDVFDDWHGAGPQADDHWRDYERARGRSFQEALHGKLCTNAYSFDKANLDAADVVVMLMPAGKSGHLELGYCIGKGKPGYILMPDGEPERWDIMYRFATGVHYNLNSLIEAIKGEVRGY